MKYVVFETKTHGSPCKIFNIIGHIEVSHAYLGRANIGWCKQRHMSDV